MNTNENNDEFIKKFPVILRRKLETGEITFPKDTEFIYKPVKVYRSIERNENDYTPINRDDFKSYAELGKTKTRGRVIDQTKPQYYGVSFYKNRVSVENLMKFPNPKKKMMVGYIHSEGGPQQTNNYEGHVCWWLYETADISGFEICKEGEK